MRLLSPRASAQSAKRWPGQGLRGRQVKQYERTRRHIAFEHGVRDNLGYRLDAQAHPTLARLLKQRGYATGGAVSAWVLRGASGIADGFDFYEDRIVAPEGADAAGRVQRRGDETASLACSWLESVRERPFFLFFHVYEPHVPYQPIQPYRSRYPLAYDGEIAWSDAIVGGLLDDCGGWRSTTAR